MKIIINHYSQPTGNTCGPTCLYMVLIYMLKHSNYLPYQNVNNLNTVESIAEACGTDWIVGTPPDRMENGMKALKIKYVEHINSKNPFDLLKKEIDFGNIPIIRTITHGMPHWIIANGYTGDIFDILDPWLGVIKYNIEQLNDIWMPRNHQFFKIIINKH